MPDPRYVLFQLERVAHVEHRASHDALTKILPAHVWVDSTPVKAELFFPCKGKVYRVHQDSLDALYRAAGFPPERIPQDRAVCECMGHLITDTNP